MPCFSSGVVAVETVYNAGLSEWGLRFLPHSPPVGNGVLQASIYPRVNKGARWSDVVHSSSIAGTAFDENALFTRCGGKVGLYVIALAQQ